MVIIYIIEFLLFGFIGWLIDSGYRSLGARKWISGGYFHGFCAVYGAGALTLIFIGKNLSDWPPALLIFFGGLCMVLVEYFGGYFSEKVLQVKLWDYSSSRFYLHGYIDLLHSFYWLILSGLFFLVIFPLILVGEKLYNFPDFLNLPALAIFIIILMWSVARRDPSRFFEIEGKIINLTVDEYKRLIDYIKKMRQARTADAKAKILEAIKKRLRNSGAKLKKGE